MSRKPIVQVPSEAQAREKLALYVYEYLYHLGAQKTAQIFLNEIGWQKSVEISDAPGFLTSWWSVFWDLYCAAPDRRDACEFSGEAKAFHDAGMHSAPMMMMVNGEMFGPTGPLEFAGPMGVGPGGVHMGMASGAHMMPFAVGPGPGGMPHGARIGSANAQMSFYGTPAGGYPPNLPPPNGLRMVGGAPFVPNGFDQHQQPAGAPSGYCGMTSPHHNMPLGGPPSVQSVQSNPSAFSSAGPPQTVANGHNRPSPWRTPNGASSYCTSPFGAASLPESTGAPPSGAVGSTPFGVMMQSDGLSNMLLGEPDALFNDKAHLLNGAPSPRSEDPLGVGLPGSAYAQYAEMTGTGAPARRGDAPENTAAAILKIKESMREEAKRFETSDSSSVMTPNSN